MSDSSPVFAKRFRHPRPISLWSANGINAPLNHSDNDARLPEPGQGDKPIGQDGWEAALEFSNFADLANKLTSSADELPEFVCGNWIFDCGPVDPYQIRRLAILAHGGPGLLDVNAEEAGVTRGGRVSRNARHNISQSQSARNADAGL